jgi:uncharacterized protein YeaO (DUF488 family)
LEKTRLENPNALFIAVSRTVPKGRIDINRTVPPYILSPSTQLLNDYKNNMISWEEYERKFRVQMNLSSDAQRKMRIVKKLSAEQDVFLVCWEGPGKNCHRHLLIEMINEME